MATLALAAECEVASCGPAARDVRRRWGAGFDRWHWLSTADLAGAWLWPTAA